jgi:putative phosphoesterase
MSTRSQGPSVAAVRAVEPRTDRWPRGHHPGPRLALLGDVHGNLAALDAVLEAARAAGITRGVLTGDLVARGRQPEECVARLSALGWLSVQGNTDGAAARSGPLSSAARAYLLGLPEMVVVRVGGVRVLVHHDPDGAERLAAAARADCVVTGHTHRPRVSRSGSLLLVDPGSVGEGLPGDPRPSWGWLEEGSRGLEAHLERVAAPLASIRTPRSARGLAARAP